MTSSLLHESWSCMNKDASDSNMSNALMTFLWEETQADQDHDEERLRSLIQALEVEIDPTTSKPDMFMDVTNVDDAQFGGGNSGDNFELPPSDIGYPNGGNCSGSGFGWGDMEMGSSSHGNETIDNSWYMNCDFDEIDCMSSTSNYGGLQGYAPFEEIGHQNVWQEACNTRMLV